MRINPISKKLPQKLSQESHASLVHPSLAIIQNASCRKEVHRFHLLSKLHVCSCSEHGRLDEGSTDCQLCLKKRDGEKIGKVQKRRHLAHLEKTFEEFMKDHCLKSLLKFKKLGFLHIILSQNVIGKDRWDIIVNETSMH